MDAGNRRSYPGSGTTWTDLSGNGINGTLTNGPTFTSENGGAVVFDGVDDQVVGQTYTLNISEKTLGGWVRLTTLPQGGGGIINHQISSGFVFDGIVYNETSNGWGFGSEAYNRTGWSGVFETSTSAWVNMVATYQNLNYRMYRNGILIYTLTSFNTYNYTTTSNFTMGLRHTSASMFSPYLIGNIAQASFYNRALTAAEVRQNFNATRGRYGI
ncbi:MAG: LamG-like jellyroll fold domain-containing protein [Gammaproteobacteria bacterium]